MPAYLKKTKNEILRQELTKITKSTQLSATGPGSIVRALADAVATQLGDMYDLLDFNVNQTLITTATGAALDQLGSVYNVARKRVNQLATIDKKLGSFMFYIANPHSSNITIPKGINVYSDTTSYMGQRFSYRTSDTTILPQGRTRVYASIEPNFSDTVYTAGKNTLIIHDAVSPQGVVLLCTNPKEIAPLNEQETDEQYRLRVIKAIRVATSGSAEAVRFAGLTVPGVRDVRIRQTPYGLGSFEAIVVPERESNTADIIGKARAAMEAVRPIGIRMYTLTPIPVPFDIDISIISPANSPQIKESLAKRASVAISRYLNTMLPGSELSFNQLIVMINDSSEAVRDVNVRKMQVDDREIMRRNYRPGANEQLTARNITVEVISA